jgi:hypothetical protein
MGLTAAGCRSQAALASTVGRHRQDTCTCTHPFLLNVTLPGSDSAGAQSNICDAVQEPHAVDGQGRAWRGHTRRFNERACMYVCVNVLWIYLCMHVCMYLCM